MVYILEDVGNDLQMIFDHVLGIKETRQANFREA
jgi:hypothetical protein